MAKTFKLKVTWVSLKQFYDKRIRKELVEWINSWLEVLKKEVDELTPEKTGDLIENNKVQLAAFLQFGRVSGSVYNDLDYAKYIEFGVQWRDYNYHKKGTVIHTWVGNRTFTRAMDNKKAEIVNIIKNKIKIWLSKI